MSLKERELNYPDFLKANEWTTMNILGRVVVFFVITYSPFLVEEEGTSGNVGH